MLRIMLILTPFSLAIAGLAVLQANVLTRTDTLATTATPPLELTGVTDVAAALPNVTETAPPAATAPDASDDMAAMTNAALASLGAEPHAAPAPAPALPEADPAMRALTADIIAGLGVAPSGAVADAGPPDQMRLITSSIVAGINGDHAAPPANVSIVDIIARARSENRSDAYIDALLNDAADLGTIEIPAALRTAEGRIDSTTLINEINRAATGAAGTPLPPELIANSDGVEVREVQENGQTVQRNFYTVQKGDSLGAIAQRFYGDAGQYLFIFKANRRVLSSPDRIRSGQKLTIPSPPAA